MAKYLQLLEARHKANLAKLALGLSRLPEDYKHFDMTDYIVLDPQESAPWPEYAGDFAPEAWLVEDSFSEGRIQEGSCATAACACGHGPGMGIDPDGFFKGKNAGSWPSYSAAAFGIVAQVNSQLGRDDLSGDVKSLNEMMWHWCFSSNWGDDDLGFSDEKHAAYDNTPHGAACRIVALLEGDIPDEYIQSYAYKRDDGEFLIEKIEADQFDLYDMDHTAIPDRLKALGLYDQAEAHFKALESGAA